MIADDGSNYYFIDLYNYTDVKLFLTALRYILHLHLIVLQAGSTVCFLHILYIFMQLSDVELIIIFRKNAC